MHPDFMAMMIRERQRELEASMRRGYPRSTATRRRRVSGRSVQLFQMAYNAGAKLWSQPTTADGAKAEPGVSAMCPQATCPSSRQTAEEAMLQRIRKAF
jgi:hypothetical protein